jgi:Ni/Co efflux regulator RcnB
MGRSIGLMSVVMAIGLGTVSSFAATTIPGQHGLVQVQYDRDQRGNNDRFGDRDPRDFRGGPLWRPGQVVPGQLLRQAVVYDWEERGLMRPPGGHQWFRVGYQFILVRERDRMIARILNFN